MIGVTLRRALLVLGVPALLVSALPSAPVGALPFTNGLESWGANSSGQLGNGTTTDSSVEGPVNVLSQVQEVSAGSDFTLALMENGSVWAWGDNSEGQLGDNTTTNSSTAVQVQGLGIDEVRAVSAGSDFSLALLRNGTVMAWGDDSNGQLGPNGTLGSYNDFPVVVPNLSQISDVQAGGAFAFAIISGGTVMAWGANSEGQLGDGTTTDSSTPVEVSGLVNDTSGIQAGSDFALAVLGNETVEAWGDDSLGQLGDGSSGTCSPQAYSDVPVQVKGLDFVRSVSAGYADAVAVGTRGVVYAWGDNSAGELGPETSASCSGVPVDVQGLVKALRVSSGSYFNLALLRDGFVEAWGSNSNGQLGDGTTTNSATPVQVEDMSGVASISAGADFSVVKAKDVPPSLPQRGQATAYTGVPFLRYFGTSSHPTLSRFSIVSGSLPSGITFADNHNNSATLSGTPSAGSSGTYYFTIEASNGLPLSAPRLAVENFKLTVKSSTTAQSKPASKKAPAATTKQQTSQVVQSPKISSTHTTKRQRR